MHLDVYSLKETLFDDEVISFNCKTIGGEITILNHHRPLITILNEGTIKIIDRNDQEHYIAVSSGFLEVTSENRAKLIVKE